MALPCLWLPPTRRLQLRGLRCDLLLPAAVQLERSSQALLAARGSYLFLLSSPQRWDGYLLRWLYGGVFLKLSACAGFCPQTWPLGSLMAQRCAYLHFALVHCPLLKRRRNVLLPRLVAKFVIAAACVALCESLSWFWITPLLPLPLPSLPLPLPAPAPAPL